MAVITDEMKLIIIAEVDKAIAGMEDWEDSVDSAGDEIDKTTKAMEADFKNLEAAANKVANGMLVWTGVVAAAGGAGLKFAGSIESQKVAFEVLTGSAETATQLYEDLQELSIKTPLEPEEVNASAEALLTFQFAVSEVDDQLIRLGDLAKGKPELLDRITTAYGRIHLKGKASMEEINMLTEAGIPILSELANQYDVTTEAIFDMVSKGEVGFEDIEKAVISLTSEGGQFEDMMEKMSQTMEGKWSTAVGSLKIALANAMESFLPIAKDMLDTVAELANKFTDLDEDAKKAILTMIGISAAIGPALKLSLAIKKNSSEMKSLLSLAKKAGPALASPWGIAALAVGAAITAVLLYRKHQKEAVEEAEKLFFSDKNNVMAEAADYWFDATLALENLDLSSLDKYVSEINKELSDMGSAVRLTRQEIIQLINDQTTWNLDTSIIEKLGITDEELSKVKDFEGDIEMLNAAITRLSEAAVKESTRTWQEWFDTITGFDPTEFGSSGTLAAQAYLDGLAAELENAESFASTIGQKLDPVPYLKEQATAIEAVLKDLYDIDPQTLEGKSFFAEGDDRAAQVLIARLNEINKELKKVGDTAEDEEEKIQSLFSSLYESEIDQIEERKQALEAYGIAERALRETSRAGLTEEAAIYENIKSSLEEMYGFGSEILTTTEQELLAVQAIASELGISESKASEVRDVMKEIPGITAGGADALVDFSQGMDDILSQQAAADLMTDSFTAIGVAMAEGTSLTGALSGAFISFTAGIFDQIGTLAIGAGLRVIMEGGLAAVPLGAFLIGLGGLAVIGASALGGGNTSGPGGYGSTADIIDQEQLLHEARMENLEEELKAAKAARTEGLKELEKLIDQEYTLLKDQWDRNLITTDQFIAETEELQKTYEETKAPLDETVTEAEEEKALEEARGDKLQELDDLLLALEEEKSTFLRPGGINWTRLQEILKIMGEIPGRISVVQAATTIGDIEAAATGADFITSGPQMLLVGENPGGRERVQVTPLSSPNVNGPQGGTSPTVIIQGDVYGIEDLYGKLQSAGFKLQTEGRV